VPPRWLYDDLGSALFDAICQLPWYRITRAETGLLARHGEAIFDALPGALEIVEFGGGSGEKLDLLLAAAARRHRAATVRLVDISGAALDAARARLDGRDAVDAVHTTQATYEAALGGLPPTVARRLILFLGSNIGNFEPADGLMFLRRICRATGPDGAVLLGADLEKPAAELLQAYDDPLHVTAAFNRNLLVRMNRELGANFPLDAFAHQAIWNAEESRVEMRLVATRAVDVKIPAAGVSTRMQAGEWIWTESSYKFTVERIGAMAAEAGFEAGLQWIDTEAGFALTLLRPRAALGTPEPPNRRT